MVDRVGFRVEGLAQVVRDLRALGLETTDLKAAFARISEEGADAVRRFTPRKSGRLAGDVRGNRAASKAVVRAGKRSVPYAGPINYGWPKRGIEPALFMQKADQYMQPRAIQLLEDEINHQIRQRGLSR